jgi:hypothetical protein
MQYRATVAGRSPFSRLPVRYLVLLIGILILAGCGGTSGRGTPAPPKAPTVSARTTGTPQAGQPAAGTATASGLKATATRPAATATPEPTAPPTATPPPPIMGTVGTNKLNVREGPSTNYPILESLPAKSTVEVIGQSKALQWFKVRLSDQREGWVSGSLLKVDADLDMIPAGYFRPLTGIVQKNSGQAGKGELTIDNGGKNDGVIVMVRDKTPITSVYVRAGEKFTIAKIPDGEYVLFFSQGEDWNGSAFTSGVANKRFEEALPFETSNNQYTTWSITLQSVAGGTGRTDSVPTDEFPSIVPDVETEGP